MMLLIHKDIPHMSLTELENDSELMWAKVIANKTSHYSSVKTFNSFEISLSTLRPNIRKFLRSTY